MRNSRKLLSLSIVVAALAWAPTVDAANMCLSEKGKLLARPGDANFCWCLASLTKQQIRKFKIEAGQVDECYITTGSIVNPATVDENNPPPPGDTPLPGDDTGDATKGNNGVGNGVDPAPPGIGNEGNDGQGQTAGSPGGSGTAPGQNN